MRGRHGLGSRYQAERGRERWGEGGVLSVWGGCIYEMKKLKNVSKECMYVSVIPVNRESLSKAPPGVAARLIKFNGLD